MCTYIYFIILNYVELISLTSLSHIFNYEKYVNVKIMPINVTENLTHDILILKRGSEECNSKLNSKLAGGRKMKLILVMRRSRSKLNHSTQSKEQPL